MCSPVPGNKSPDEPEMFPEQKNKRTFIAAFYQFKNFRIRFRVKHWDANLR